MTASQNIRRLSAATLALLVSLFDAPRADAQAGGKFEDADTNHDGRISLEEYEIYATRRLMEANGPMAQKFKKLSPQQQEERLRRRFNMLDHGRKGYLDRSDWNDAADRISAAAGRRSGGIPSEGLTIGGGLSDVNPGYVGYHRRLDPFPLLSYRWDRLFVSGTNAGWIASEGADYTLSVVLAPQFMRVKASNSPELAGITDRRWTIDGGLNLTVRREYGNISWTALHDVLDRNNGTEVKFEYSYPLALGAGSLTPGVGLKWESAGLTNYYYGVSAAEALPTRSMYAPGAALNPSVRLGYSVPFSPEWRLGADVSYTHFDRAIRNSPLIDESGSFAFTLTLLRSFSFGSTRPIPAPITLQEH